MLKYRIVIEVDVEEVEGLDPVAVENEVRTSAESGRDYFEADADLLLASWQVVKVERRT